MQVFILASLLLSSCSFTPTVRGPASEKLTRDCGLDPAMSLEERIKDCNQELRDHAKEPLARWVIRDQGKEFIYDVITKTLWAPASDSAVSLEEARKSCTNFSQLFPALKMKWKLASKEDYLRAFDKWYVPRSTANKIAYPDERYARIFPYLIIEKEQKYFWTNTRVKFKLPGSSDYQFVVDQRPSYLTPVRMSLRDRYFKTAYYRCVAKHLEDEDLSDQEN